MFNLEQSIKDWRKSLEKHPGLEPGYIEELEAHLRDKIDHLQQSKGMDAQSAFRKARADVGEGIEIEEVAKEFQLSRTGGKKQPAWKARSWVPALLPNFLKTFFRNLWRQKVVSAINIFGLATGVACCIFIFLYVWDELTYDAFHTNGERIYRVVEDFHTPDNENRIAIIENAMGPVLQREIPEVEQTARLYRGWRLTAGPVESARIVRDYFLADSTLFSILDFPLKWGDPATALSRPGSVVLSKELASNLYGERNPVGESIRLEAEDFPEFGETGFTVTGVLRRIPDNSHLQFELLLSKSTVSRFEQWDEFFSSWEGFFAATYVLLDDPGSRDRAERAINRLIATNRGEEIAAQKTASLQPLSEIHFYSSDITYENNHEEGQLSYIYLFSLIALVILVIACINYMNLTTARSVFRAKEIGLRKTAGADRLQLVAQFLGESMLTTVTALLLSLALLFLLLPYFNALAGKQVAYDIFYSGWILSGMAGLALIIGIGAGLYPALFLSGFQPASVLKGKFKTDNARLRKGLVIVQFTLSIVMISATLIAYNQMQFIRAKNLGFDEEQVMVVDINHDDLQRNFLTVKEELLRSSAIEHVTVSSRVPADWKGFRQTNVNTPAGNPEEAIEMYFDAVDESFLPTYDIELIEGRNFIRERASDSTALILNRTAAGLLFPGGEEPLGNLLTLNDDGFTGRVIGIVDDFHYHSLHEKIQPLVMGLISRAGSHPIHGIDYFSIKMGGQNVEQAVEHVTAVHNTFDPVNPIEYSFLNEWIADQYRQDRVVGRLFGIAAGLAVIIACIGLFGLASFFAEKRTKEIGIRKVLGATVSSVVALLSKDFLKLIGIALVVAVPVAWYLGRQWLENFAYRVEIGFGVFLLSGGIAMLIALLAVSGQSLRAALANPAGSLRSE